MKNAKYSVAKWANDKNKEYKKIQQFIDRPDIRNVT